MHSLLPWLLDRIFASNPEYQTFIYSYGWMDQVLYPTVWGEESKRLNYSVAHGNQFLWGVRLRQLRTKSSDALIKDEVCKFPDFSNIMDRGSLEAGYEDICHPVYGHCKWQQSLLYLHSLHS